eukprot:TRINITY_DN18182_c0_g1_i2.p1 TRINITY_DN18182_c0_g1~~TRINITY_DN18182_c0_g1_i2.p1  ORF type:complete len:306 (+),score=64.48 TRINITY_DN18182_c0_g1_i2:150-1067(+)
MSKDNEVARVAMERSEEEVDIVAMMLRSEFASGSQWGLHFVDEPAQDGQHFIDILEPSIGNLIRKHIPGAPKRQKVAFAMEKGSVVDLPASQSVKCITAGLGWDVTGDGIDLDVSAVLFDSSAAVHEIIFFGNLKGSGLEHTGDNLTGAGEGDDEQIKCDLARVPAHVLQIFFVVNIYTRGKTFQKVKNPYCRVVDESNTELARYELREGGKENGLIISRLMRSSAGDRWSFQAIGSFSRGSIAKDCVPDMRDIFYKKPQAFQLRGQSTMDFMTESAAPDSRKGPREFARAQPAAVANKECCVLQ